jgi:hypothetical protein
MEDKRNSCRRGKSNDRTHHAPDREKGSKVSARTKTVRMVRTPKITWNKPSQTIFLTTVVSGPIAPDPPIIRFPSLSTLLEFGEQILHHLIFLSGVCRGKGILNRSLLIYIVAFY